MVDYAKIMEFPCNTINLSLKFRPKLVQMCVSEFNGIRTNLGKELETDMFSFFAVHLLVKCNKATWMFIGSLLGLIPRMDLLYFWFRLYKFICALILNNLLVSVFKVLTSGTNLDLVNLIGLLLVLIQDFNQSEFWDLSLC